MSKPSRSSGKLERAGKTKRGAARRDFEALRERRLRAAEMFDRR